MSHATKFDSYKEAINRIDRNINRPRISFAAVATFYLCSSVAGATLSILLLRADVLLRLKDPKYMVALIGVSLVTFLLSMLFLSKQIKPVSFRPEDL